jgi:hypothetical protein
MDRFQDGTARLTVFCGTWLRLACSWAPSRTRVAARLSRSAAMLADTRALAACSSARFAVQNG